LLFKNLFQELAKVLGVTPQALYASSIRIASDNVIRPEDLERWCAQYVV